MWRVLAAIFSYCAFSSEPQTCIYALPWFIWPFGSYHFLPCLLLEAWTCAYALPCYVLLCPLGLSKDQFPVLFLVSRALVEFFRPWLHNLSFLWRLLPFIINKVSSFIRVQQAVAVLKFPSHWLFHPLPSLPSALPILNSPTPDTDPCYYNSYLAP